MRLLPFRNKMNKTLLDPTVFLFFLVSDGVMTHLGRFLHEMRRQDINRFRLLLLILVSGGGYDENGLLPRRKNQIDAVRF